MYATFQVPCLPAVTHCQFYWLPHEELPADPRHSDGVTLVGSGCKLVMEDVEQESRSVFHTPPRFWRRYVNDTCTAFPSDVVNSFHNHLNSINPCISWRWRMSWTDSSSSLTSSWSEKKWLYQHFCTSQGHPHRSVSVLSLPPSCISNKQAVERMLMCTLETLSVSGVSRARKEKLVLQDLQGNG